MGLGTVLSGRELEVARLVAEDLPDKIIASILQISVHTVDEYLSRIGKKIGAHNTPHSRRRAIARFVITLETPRDPTHETNAA